METLENHDQASWFAAFIELNPEATKQDFDDYRAWVIENITGKPVVLN